jgi:hypothetical protein
MNRLAPLPVVAALALAFAPSARAQTAALDALRTQLAAGADPAVVLGGAFDNSAAPSGPAAVRADALPSGSRMTQAQLTQTMLQNLDFIQSAFAAQYGPGQWKESHNGWDLDAQIAAAKQKVQSTPNITIAQYHDVLRQFFNSMKDFHVSVQFASTEASSLPFTISGAGGHYFITSINTDRLSPASFPFHVGDELISFGGKPIAQVVAQLQARLGGNTDLTDRALAEMYLTSRSGAGFGDVTNGPVNVSVKPKGSDQVVTRQLTWDYSPELVSNPVRQPFGIQSVPSTPTSAPAIPSMLSPMAAQTSGPDAAANPFGLGNKQSFVPPLGDVVWKSDDDAIFYAYMFKTPGGHTSGYVRIPSYETDDADAAVAEFAALMKLFQDKADGLVIDQVDNPGGSVPYLYALASMLAKDPLTTPPHHVAITQDDVTQAAQLVALAPRVTSDAIAQQALGGGVGRTLDGYPITRDPVWLNMLDYSRFVIAQWNQGKTLTDPVHIEGVNAINPSNVAAFTKPILLLINELDFSGGDFFPAIMQDNKRATLFGTRTAGAGGFVRQVTYPNQVGIAQFTMTGSIAVRADHQPIENLGVTAEVQYSPSAADLQDGFQEYAHAADSALDRLLGASSTASR